MYSTFAHTRVIFVTCSDDVTFSQKLQNFEYSLWGLSSSNAKPRILAIALRTELKMRSIHTDPSCVLWLISTSVSSISRNPCTEAAVHFDTKCASQLEQNPVRSSQQRADEVECAKSQIIALDQREETEQKQEIVSVTQRICGYARAEVRWKQCFAWSAI